MAQAHATLQKHFTIGDIQTNKLLSIKTGGCTEDCAYCSQAARYQTDVSVEALLPLDTVVSHAPRRKGAGYGTDRLIWLYASYQSNRITHAFDYRYVNPQSELWQEKCIAFGD